MLKRSKLTSYLGMISLGLVIIPWILMNILGLDYGDITYIILLPGIFCGLIIFPTIVCSYFELQVPKQNFRSYLPLERQSIGRVLSLIYGITFLFFGILLPSVLLLTSEWTILTISVLNYFPWITSGILGIVGAIVYRDTSRDLSSDENLKRRKIGFSVVMICTILLVTSRVFLNTRAP